MAAATYRKGHWKTEVGAEELAGGKFQGVVLLFHERGESPEQIRHTTTDIFDTADGAVAEAKILARHILDDL